MFESSNLRFFIRDMFFRDDAITFFAYRNILIEKFNEKKMNVLTNVMNSMNCIVRTCDRRVFDFLSTIFKISKIDECEIIEININRYMIIMF